MCVLTACSHCGTRDIYGVCSLFQLLSDVNIVPLLRDLVLVAGWVDVASSLKLVLADMQVCKEHVAILFAVTSDSQVQYGLGTVVRDLVTS